MLAKDQEFRLTIEELMLHPFIDDFDTTVASALAADSIQTGESCIYFLACVSALTYQREIVLSV